MSHTQGISQPRAGDLAMFTSSGPVHSTNTIPDMGPQYQGCLQSHLTVLSFELLADCEPFLCYISEEDGCHQAECHFILVFIGRGSLWGSGCDGLRSGNPGCLTGIRLHF